MPEAWSDKDERQYDEIRKSAKKRGRSTKRAKEIAARTVNKQRSEEGRTKSKKGSTKKKSSSKKKGSRKSSSKSKSTKKSKKK